MNAAPITDCSPPTWAVTLFRGDLRPLPGDGRPTGIFKSPLGGPCRVGQEGLEGDTQADRRVHGGPEKAVHAYPATHYPTLAQAFEDAHAALVPGSLGENLSVTGLTEADVCIGDCFRLGDVLLEVSQPRTPCWKIDTRFGVTGMAEFIATQGCTGWYFRVREGGSITPGDALVLTHRVSGNASVAALLASWGEHRPDPVWLDHLAAQPGLTPAWGKRLRARAEWLRAHAGADAPRRWHPQEAQG